MNVLDLLREIGIEAKRVTLAEWHSPCPECGGRDRFSVWPEKPNSDGRYRGGRFTCRQCAWSGDAIEFLRKRKGMNYREACQALNIDPVLPAKIIQTKTAAWIPASPKPAPSASWTDAANRFMLSCQKELERNQEALQWLKTERGLNLETIRRFRLGWNGQDRYDKRESWGLPPETNAKGRPKQVWLPAGLTIPLVDGAGQVIRLRIRRQNPQDGARYIVTPGSSMRPMTIWDDQKAVVVLESELDALLVAQEAGDLVGVVAMGSAQQRPDSMLHERLTQSEMALVCLDTDAAGAQASWRFWRQYRGFKRWPTIRSKDVGEQWKNGIPVRKWIEAALPKQPSPRQTDALWPPMPLNYVTTAIKPEWIVHTHFLQACSLSCDAYLLEERKAIMMIDGGVSEIEAEIGALQEAGRSDCGAQTSNT
jgi:hypothetical protein